MNLRDLCIFLCDMWLLPYMQGGDGRKVTLPQLNLIFSVSTALKATERKDTKWKRKFSLPSFKPSTIMILTARKLCEEEFLSSYPLDLLRSPIISKVELLITYSKHLRNDVSESTKVLFMGSSRALINNAIWHGAASFCHALLDMAAVLMGCTHHTEVCRHIWLTERCVEDICSIIQSSSELGCKTPLNFHLYL